MKNTTPYPIEDHCPPDCPVCRDEYLDMQANDARWESARERRVIRFVDAIANTILVIVALLFVAACWHAYDSGAVARLVAR